MHQLVHSCPPLDVNSTYAYLLLCTHFSDTSVIAERDGKILGFVSAYLKPSDPSVVFVWQVAVDSSSRGLGIGQRMLSELRARPACRQVSYLETTISPSNEQSKRMFHSFAKHVSARCEWGPLFGGEHFGHEQHEEEHLLRIGPFTSQKLGGA